MYPDINKEVAAKLNEQIRKLADLAESNREIAHMYANIGDIWAVHTFVKRSITYENEIRRVDRELVGIKGRESQ